MRVIVAAKAVIWALAWLWPAWPGGAVVMNASQHMLPANLDTRQFIRSLNPVANSQSLLKYILFLLYDKTSRPVLNDSIAVTVDIGLSLYQILDTDEKSQTLTTLLAIRYMWNDIGLKWDKTLMGVDHFWVPPTLIWQPDIVINNNAESSFLRRPSTSAIVYHDGTVVWMFPQVVTTYCNLDVTYFPFDQQNCDFVFISWTYGGLQLDLQAGRMQSFANFYNEVNQEWALKNFSYQRNEKIYPCCPEPFPDLTFTLTIQRRSAFYVVNLVLPCLMMHAVSLIGFFLPPDCNDKIALEMTIMLAMVVFLMVIGEMLPPAPDKLPLIGIYMCFTMLMVAIALVMATVVMQVHYRKQSGRRVPALLKFLFLQKCCASGAGAKGLKPVELRQLFGVGNKARLPWQQGLTIDNHGAAACGGIHIQVVDGSGKRFSYVEQMDKGARAGSSGNGNGASGDGGSAGSGCSERRAASQSEPTDAHDHRAHAEWVMLALCLDTFFFRLFLLFSVTIQLMFFISIL